MVDESVPEYVFGKISSVYFTKIEVLQYQKARLYFNQKFVKLLESGTYYFWKTSVKVDVVGNAVIQIKVYANRNFILR